MAIIVSNSFVQSPTPVASGSPTSTASIVGYDNVFLQAGCTVTASGEVVGFEKENAIDWKQYDWWKTAGTGTHWIKAALSAPYECNYGAVWGHNLNLVGGDFKFQHSSDNSVWVDAHTVVSVSTPNLQVVTFTAPARQYWRLLVTTASGASIIAGVQLGRSLALGHGLGVGAEINALAPSVESKTADSDGGVLLGVSVKRTTVAGSIDLNNLDPQWVRDEIAPLISHLNSGKPCIFSWNPDEYPDECLLIWKGSEKINPPKYTTALMMGFNFSFEGVL